MTLYDIIQTIERVARSQPTINMIVENDIWKLNAEPSAEYGVFGFRQTEHTANINEGWINYAFEFYYIDRLTNDLSNQIEIQCVGVQTLDNIVRQLYEEGLIIGEYRFTPFYQKFADECSGVICTLTIGAGIETMCATENNSKTVKII